MTLPHEQLRCPSCNTSMTTGYLPVSDGLHFIRGDGKAAANFAEDIPGTHSILRSNRLLAWRCKSCQVVVFKYGRDNAKQIERMHEIDEAKEEDTANSETTGE